jgi:thiol-disulfide isomerase/thioredoxin
MEHSFKMLKSALSIIFIFSLQLLLLSPVLAQIKKGDVAPDFSVKDTSGTNISLYDLKGKVIILDFWASWCGPCRAANPELVKIYQDYHDLGLEVFSVSLDDKKEPWLKAISKDKLTWKWHGTDYKGWDSMPAMLYGINAVPTSILLDKEMNVLLVTHEMRDVQKKLKDVFSKK